MTIEDVERIGWYFVQEYYTCLNKEPLSLHRFYMKDSTFVHGVEGESADPYTGQHQIHERIVECKFVNCKVLVSNVDSQPSFQGGIMIQVLGELSNNDKPSHKFAQTFFLAKQPNGYYVLNDMFRFLKEDVDTTYEETTDPVVKEQQLLFSKEAARAASSTNKEIVEISAHNVSPKKDSIVSQTKAASPVEKSSETVAKVALEKITPSGKDKQTGSSAAITRKAPHQSADSHQKQAKEKSELAIDDVAAPTTALQSPSKPTNTTQQQSNSNVSLNLKTTQTASVKSAQEPLINLQETPKPKTWASLAATNSDKFSGAIASVPGQVISTSSSPVQTPKTQKSLDKSVTSDKPVSRIQPTTNGHVKGDEFLTVKKSNHSQQVETHSAEEREKFSVYVKNLNSSTTDIQLIEAFSFLGEIRNVDILPFKNIAFIEFTSFDTVGKAIGKSAMVNGTKLILEERKKRVKKHHGDYKKQRDSREEGGKH